MTINSKRLREEAVRWFTRMQKAEPDHPDRSRFEAWLLSNPAHASEYEAFAETWEDFDSTSRLQSLAKALEFKKTHLDKNVPKTIRNSLVGIFLVFGASLIGYQSWMSQPVYELALSTEVGGIKRQHLADGSALVLNADSKVGVTYYRNKRVVTLTKGEVVFDVTPDADRPFIVEGGHARVTVLGTHFVVNKLNKLVRVSVNHGRVKVESRLNGEHMHPEVLILGNGEVAEIKPEQAPQRVQRNALDAFSFQAGALTFQQSTMDEIAETLSRYRQPRIISMVPDKAAHVTAVVQINDIENFLASLPRIAPVNVQRTGEATTLILRNSAL